MVGRAWLGACVVAGWVLGGLPAVAGAQSVRVVPDRTSMALGETLRLEILLGGRYETSNGPDLGDFDVVGRSSGTSVSVVGGQVQQEARVSLALAPKKAGNLTIGAVELLTGGKVVASSKPVTIRVGGAGPGPAPSGPAAGPAAVEPGEGVEARAAPEPSPPAGSTVPEKYAGRQVFVLARAPNRPVYVGEPVYIEYLLFTRGDVPLAGIRLEGMPKLKGFVVEAGREGSDKASRVRVGGQAYDVRTLWRGAVTAIDAGRAVLDPMTAGLYVGDFFGRRHYAVASDPVALDFQAVPATGRPADFVEGTLGSFVLKASVDRKVVPVGESAILTVEVTGTGNLRGVKAPTLEAPEGLRISRVPSADLDELMVDVGGVSGRRAFQYLLAPEREGDFEVGRVALPYFNPITGKYERARTEPVRVSAQGGRGRKGQFEVRQGEPVVGFIAAADLTPVAPPPSREGAPAGLVYAGMALPVAFWLGAEAAMRRRAWLERNGARIRGRGALKRARTGLDRLAARAPGPDFWAAADGVVREYLAERFGIPAQTRTAGELATDLAMLGAPADVVESLAAEMDACAFGRFAPSASQDRDRAATVARLRETLAALDRVPDREGRSA